METKPKINSVAVFFIIFIVIEVFLSGIWFVNMVINEPSASTVAPNDEGKLLDQNKYYEIVNPSLTAQDKPNTSEIRNPFEILK
jgi:regulatory protein YycI of two-component signal transduction system YycFG